MDKDIKIAVLLTCHNRKEKTLSCLSSLFASRSHYNNIHDPKISLEIFLVDDGSNDGTFEVVRELSHTTGNVNIIKGDGNLFWAGGMRLAWKHALAANTDWNFYLLLNDDTTLYNDCFDKLFEAHQYSLTEFGKPGMYSGFTCEIGKIENVTYGGIIWESKIWAKHRDLTPMGYPQMCDASNANILLIDSSVVNSIGVFYEGYQHGYADYDYSMHARKKGVPVLVTAQLCGECNNDHVTIGKKMLEMNYNERKEYYSKPLHSYKEYLLFFRRNLPFRYPITAMGCILKMFFPQIYLKIQGLV